MLKAQPNRCERRGARLLFAVLLTQHRKTVNQLSSNMEPHEVQALSRSSSSRSGADGTPGDGPAAQDDGRTSTADRGLCNGRTLNTVTSEAIADGGSERATSLPDPNTAEGADLAEVLSPTARRKHFTQRAVRRPLLHVAETAGDQDAEDAGEEAHTGEEEHRGATVSELFFDLMFFLPLHALGSSLPQSSLEWEPIKKHATGWVSVGLGPLRSRSVSVRLPQSRSVPARLGRSRGQSWSVSVSVGPSQSVSYRHFFPPLHAFCSSSSPKLAPQ